MPFRLTGPGDPEFGEPEVAAAYEVDDEGVAGLAGDGAGVDVGVADDGRGVGECGGCCEVGVGRMS